jgi:hypothetical protein
MSRYDSSTLTKLKSDRNQSSYFIRQQNLQAAAQPGVFVQSYNPQSGTFDASKFTDIKNGSINTFYRSSPATIISYSPTYLDISGAYIYTTTQNINVPIVQPVNNCSPVQ